MNHSNSLIEEAEAKLLEEKRRLEKKLQYVNQSLESMRMARNGSNDGLESLPSVKPGQFAAMKTGEALNSYLKARAGFRIPIDQVVQDLLEGGAVMASTPQRNRHNLKITMQRNRRLVKWDENWTMWLNEEEALTIVPRIPRRKLLGQS